MTFTKSCPICGKNEFVNNKVLWAELIDAWELNQSEVEYINRQQGFSCVGCGSNLRSMALAAAILRSYLFDGTMVEFVRSNLARSLNVLEINEAGGLFAVLADLPNHQLVSYPEYDMTDLDFKHGTFDLVIHSDTLEHVEQPVVALSECGRVLRAQGRCIFTVPIIVGRMTRSRIGLNKSYHGSSVKEDDDLLVQTEFGADVWCYAAEAGFRDIKIHNFEYPAGLAVEVAMYE